MRTLLLMIGLALAASADAAPRKARPRAPAPAASPVVAVAEAPAPPTDAEQLAMARQQMDLARAEIQRLRPLAEEAEAQRATIAELRARNERLVAAGNGLVAAFEQRFGKSLRFDPFNAARTKFETDMQQTRDTLYQNSADAPPVRENAVNDPATPPKSEP